MNIDIDELSRLAIAEVEKDLLKKQEENKNIQEDVLLNEKPFVDDVSVVEKVDFTPKITPKEEIKIYSDFEKNEISEHEKIYLKKIRERILVLFEALNTKQNEEDLQKRLETTISFIEFLLASIENRIKD